MTIRKLTAIDNECYFRWYEFSRKGNRPVVMRQEEIAVVEKDGLFGAGVMVARVPDSSCCAFTAICRNPFVDREFSSEAVDFLIKHYGAIAKKLGYTHWVSVVEDDLARARYRKCGAKEFKNPCTLFWGEA